MSDMQPGAGSRRRVVVGVDGTPNSLAALRRAAYQARKRDAELDDVIPAGANGAAEASGYEMLNMSVRHIFPHGLHGPADRIVARGKAAQTLVRLSAGPELLVIGARIHSECGNLPGGGVVPYCLSRASCPVDIRAPFAQPGSSDLP
jgi:hypothetical protein